MTTRAIAVLVLALAGPVSAWAQDPVPLYPENYKILVENERVRVMDFMLRKGVTERMHQHPAHVLYVLEGFKIRFTFPDGRTAVREARTGDVLFSEAVMHSPVNIGDTDAHGILIELKGAATAGASALPAAGDVLTAFTFIHGLPGREDDLESHLLSLTAPTRAEPGCLAYDLYQARDRKNEFLRFETWRDPEALEAHKKTPHLMASFARRQAEGWTTEITLWDPVRP